MDEQQTPAVTPAKQSEGKGVRTLFDYVEMFVLSAAFVLLLLTFCFRVCVVEGPSMNQTLINGEKLIVSDLFYTPKQGDIIVFHHTSDTYTEYNEPIVKRVIATEGQKLEINFYTGEIKVDGVLYPDTHRVLKEPSGMYSIFPDDIDHYDSYTGIYSITIPENTLFVMGDNRNHSLDSRDEAIGFIDERCVLGKVILRFAPFDILA